MECKKKDCQVKNALSISGGSVEIPVNLEWKDIHYNSFKNAGFIHIFIHL